MIKLCEGRELPEILQPEKLKEKHKEVFRQLTYNFESASSYQIKPDFLAFDTETYASNGDLMTLCLSTGDHIEFKKGKAEFSDIVQFFKPYFRRKVSIFAWNLGFDATVLLKSLGKEILDFKKSEYEMMFGKYKLRYIPKKSLSLSDGNRHSVTFYDIASLFGKMKLDDAGKKFIGDQKQYLGKYQDKKFPDDILNDPVESEEVIKYCIQDAKLTEKLSYYWIDNFYKAFKIYPKRYHSAGTIAIQYLKTKLPYWNSFFTIPYNVQQLAFLCYFGGRFEVLKRGTFINVFHYDINSAYPYAMSILPDFNKGHWVEVKNLKDFDEKILKYAGFFEIDVKVNENFISPFLYRPIAKSNIYAPKGRFKTFTTNHELEVALKHYDIKLFSLKGWFFVPDESKQWEFNKIIKEMYRQRLNQKDEGQKFVYKVIINSLYGKTAQVKPNPTSFYSPVVCAFITGKCRAMLLDAVKDKKEDVIGFATDAIFSESPLKIPVSKSKELGKYSFEFHRDFTIFMSGVYSFNYFDHKDKKWNRQTQSRGFKITCLKDNGDTYKLDLKDSDITEDREKNKYFIKIKYMLPNTISASISSHKIGIENISKMRNQDKEIDLNGDHKRLWLQPLKRLDDLQKSYCLDVKLL
ncbi:hypothetical protein [Nitrosopumilus spindle-shaped virus]|uniref:DNA-directed DNA polymerase n=1 Tax=Nitrosopumilus spindle-shaped virus TaxID=2508184 RepID=A0A514K331_9VIRU|nr:hypothetical protein [Nitrosopumilus spindle-shaped virus]